MTPRGPFKTPSLADLLPLASWPKNTVGYVDDVQLIWTLHRLCEKHGYGWVHQLVGQIEDIWRNPERAEYWKQWHAERLRNLEEQR
jgi:hypothetical protein